MDKDVYSAVRRVAKENGLEVSDSAVYRTVGSIRSAGTVSASVFDEIVLNELQSYEAGNKKDNNGTKDQDKDSPFRQIDASLASGKCPRCGKTMRKVKLADYTPATYCGDECRITLWSESGD